MKTYIKPSLEKIELREMESVMLGLSMTNADDSEVFANPFRGLGGNPFGGSSFGGTETMHP